MCVCMYVYTEREMLDEMRRERERERRDGKREGKGTYHVHVDAKKWWEFVGMFVNDEIKGEGTMTRSNGSQRPIDWKVKTAIFPLTGKEVWTWWSRGGHH